MKHLGLNRVIQLKEDSGSKGGEAARTLETCIWSRYRVKIGSRM
jgi:hypothetical protein